ncbi:MAG: outer membrane lipoprotein-sorting protein [SAR324 cluster bacterium]|nr:outer membrane lipoprotein-sorting protein [SAR324 cluster bacterium]
MKKFIIILGLLSLFSPLTLQAQTAAEVMKKVDVQAKATSNSSFSIMSLSSCKFAKKGKRISCTEKPRVKKMENAQINTGKGNLDSKSIAILLAPASEKGIGMLSFSYDNPQKDSESWLYLSALGKVKRMAGGSDEDAEPTALFGSEFTTEDMETGKLDEYTYKILKETKYAGRPVWIIESTPKPARLKKTRYAKSIVWVDKDRLITLKVQTFDKKNKPYKRLTFGKVEQIQGQWLARSIIIVNQQTSRLTKMAMEKIVLNIKVSEDFLSQRALTDFAFRENHLNKLRSQMK